MKEHGIAGDRDEARDCWVLGEEEENAVLDLLEPEMAKGGCVLEHHRSASGSFVALFPLCILRVVVWVREH